MNIICLVQGNSPQIGILSIRCSINWVKVDYHDNKWYTTLYKNRIQRYKYVIFLFE